MILSFPHMHLVVVLKTPGTPKNIFCFNNNTMNDNSKQEHPGKNKFGRTLFVELRGRDTRTLPRIFGMFLIPKKIPTQIKPPKKILAKFSYPKKSRNQKFQTPKNPSIIPIT